MRSTTAYSRKKPLPTWWNCTVARVRSAVIVSAQRIKSNLYLIPSKLSHMHLERLRHCYSPTSPLLTADYTERRTAAAAAAAVTRRLTRRRRVGETGGLVTQSQKFVLKNLKFRRSFTGFYRDSKPQATTFVREFTT